MATVDQLLFVLTLFAALGCGLVAGVFFAFSAFVMKALSRLPPSEGIAAMQSINVAVLNLWFMAAFFVATVPSAESLGSKKSFLPNSTRGARVGNSAVAISCGSGLKNCFALSTKVASAPEA